jgi:hypothetical protein
VSASLVDSSAVRSGRPAVSRSSTPAPTPWPWWPGATCSSATSNESSSQAAAAPSPLRAASARLTVSCHHWPDRAVEAVAEADRLAGPVVGDRQRAEPRVAGVPGHDRPAARQQLGRRAHRGRVHRDQLVEPGDELGRAQLADRDRSRG